MKPNDNIIKLQCLGHLLGSTLSVLEDYIQTADLPLTVKSNLDKIVTDARKRQQEIVLFGGFEDETKKRETEDDQTTD